MPWLLFKSLEVQSQIVLETNSRDSLARNKAGQGSASALSNAGLNR